MLKFLLLKHQQNAALAITGSSLHLDSSNVLSYPGSGATWTDLSPSANNFTLVGGPTYDAADAKSINFDFGTQYAASTFNKRIGPGHATTIEMVFKRTALFSNNTMLGHNRNGSPHGFIQELDAGSTFGIVVITTNNPPYGFGANHSTSIANNTWYHGVISMNIPYHPSAPQTVTGNISVNGSVQSFSQTLPCDAGAYDYKLELCRAVNWSFNISYGKFKIGLVRIYDRQLTTAEMIQNYNSCRTRFGI